MWSGKRDVADYIEDLKTIWTHPNENMLQKRTTNKNSFKDTREQEICHISHNSIHAEKL